jgi:Double-GTPase 2
MDEQNYKLVGYDCPLGSYPSPAVPIVCDYNNKYKAVYLDDNLKLCIDSVVETASFFRLSDCDINAKKKLEIFDYRKHRLYALSEDNVECYKVEDEIAFFVGLLRDSNFSKDNLLVRVSLAEATGKKDLLDRELQNYEQYLQEHKPNWLNFWYEEKKAFNEKFQQAEEIAYTLPKNPVTVKKESEVGADYTNTLTLTKTSRLDLNNRLKSYRDTLTKWLKQESLPTSARTIRLGIWGTRGSGKTTYLAMLYDALQLSPKWEINVDEKARNFVEEHLTTIDVERVFPLPTEPSQKLEVFSYTLRPDTSGVANSTIVLNFIDAPGEFYEDISKASAKIDNPDAQTHELEEQSMDIVDYLIRCDGIIFLLDPMRSKEDGRAYSTLLRNLFQEFQKRSRRSDMRSERLEQYMAFCVTKVDREDLWSKGQKSDELAQKVMGLELERLKNFCWLELNQERRKNKSAKENRCEFFSVSSIGRYKDKDGKWQPAVIEPTENNNPNPEVNTPLVAPQEQPKNPYQRSRPPQSTNPNSSSSSSSSNWALGTGNNIENKPASSPKLQPTIKPDVKLNSHNVLEPIEWLIRGIQNYPPSRRRK